MLDGSDPRVAAVGWSVVAVKDGVVVAIARGRAPRYITNIQSAEIWALAIATKLSRAARSYTDCEAVATVARGGYRYATSSKQLYARAWREVFNNTERCAPDVVWMPAHKGQEAVGELVIGDGSLLTEEQRIFNALADKHAKVAAASDRVGSQIRQSIERVQAQAAAVADWIARATYAANHSGGSPPRDSTGEKPAGFGRHGNEKRGRTEGRSVPQSRPAQQGGHSLTCEEGLWRCSVCRRTSEQWHRIAPGICRGAAEWHWAQRAELMACRHQIDGAGHRRAAYGSLTWCLRCGSYAVAWAKGLALPCKGAPDNPSQQRVKARLMGGRHPRTNRPLQVPLQLEVRADLAPGEDQAQEHSLGPPMPMRTQTPRSAAGYLRLPGGDAAAFTRIADADGRRHQDGEEENEMAAGPRPYAQQVELEAEELPVTTWAPPLEGDREGARGEALSASAGGHRARKDLLRDLRARTLEDEARRTPATHYRAWGGSPSPPRPRGSDLDVRMTADSSDVASLIAARRGVKRGLAQECTGEWRRQNQPVRRRLNEREHKLEAVEAAVLGLMPSGNRKRL